MEKIPISLFVDDGAPHVSVYWYHAESRIAADGEPLVKEIPLDFMHSFYNVVARYGIKGKFSIVPMPIGENKSNIADGLLDIPADETKKWLAFAKEKLGVYFDFSPEMLTHNKAFNIETQSFLEERESVWSQTKDRETLTEYITYALEIMKRAGFVEICGVSSPWNFGAEVEGEYVSALSEAICKVYGKTDAWYALHTHYAPSGHPKPIFLENGRKVVRFSNTIRDIYNQADEIITEDGKSGELINVLKAGGIPVILMHWQKLYGNGSESGLEMLSAVAERIERHFGNKLYWVKAKELMHFSVEGIYE